MNQSTLFKPLRRLPGGSRIRPEDSDRILNEYWEWVQDPSRNFPTFTYNGEPWVIEGDILGFLILALYVDAGPERPVAETHYVIVSEDRLVSDIICLPAVKSQPDVKRLETLQIATVLQQLL